MAEGRGAELSVGQMKDESEDEKEAEQDCRFKEEESEHEEAHCVFGGDHLGDILFQADEEGVAEVGGADEPKDIPKVADQAEEARCLLDVVFPEPDVRGCQNEEKHLHDDGRVANMCGVV